MPLRIALIAGEASGDQLGAHLIAALRARENAVEVMGVAGAAMRAAGCEPLADVDDMSVMGFAELAIHLRRLLALRRRLVRELSARKPDLVVGIDVPDFNLGLERRLRERGLATAHYVSPSVWAWRPGRVHAVARAAECVLCLLPFEPQCYAAADVKAVFVGHPLVDALRARPREDARPALGLATGPVLAILPGSRAVEVKQLAGTFVAAAAALRRMQPELQVVIPLARPSLRPGIEAAIAKTGLAGATLLDGQAHAAISAADVVLSASGTATLETLLLERPMVVAYRVQAFTAWMLRRPGVLRTRCFSLPNLIAERKIVPELLQEEASAAKISATLRLLLDNPEARNAQLAAFDSVREKLGSDAAGR
ncbi:MAG TPA: lipid-A-disaccharide synthase, partial [Gammaproteobacteria bacterium]|nr:lipid-A-disaccharide synthase [Gammaproteobacteria bacterium]